VLHPLARTLGVALLVFLLCSGTAEARPNIVVVMTDDQRADSLRYMPSVRALGGTTYTRHYAVQPLCCPSRATFLSGQYPHNHGIVSNHPSREMAEAIETQALPTWLDGYTTAYAGKYLNRYPWGELYVPPDWDEWYAHAGGPFSISFSTDYYDGTQVISRPEHDTEVLTEWATDFLRRRAPEPEPLFLAVMPSAPHQRGDADGRPVPLPEDAGTFAGARPPGRAARREQMGDKSKFLRKRSPTSERAAAQYWQRHLEALQGVDRLVAAIRSELEAAGEWEDTVLIFTSDNGWMLGEHRVERKDAPYEESARVPLVVTGPGWSDRKDPRLTGNVDLPVTIARLADVQPAPPQDGRPLWGQRRKRLLLEGEGETSGVRPWQAVVTRRHSFINWRGRGGRELYDLRVDPRQLEAQRGRKRLKRRLDRAIVRLAER
jgi:N-acetylglucosamine-6-sulfatase